MSAACRVSLSDVPLSICKVTYTTLYIFLCPVSSMNARCIRVMSSTILTVSPLVIIDHHVRCAVRRATSRVPCQDKRENVNHTRKTLKDSSQQPPICCVPFTNTGMLSHDVIPEMSVVACLQTCVLLVTRDQTRRVTSEPRDARGGLRLMQDSIPRPSKRSRHQL